jgi:hypothetical protein
MLPSSRTPEGEPNRCVLCGQALRIEPSLDTLDAVCPHCGSLVWFSETAIPATEPVEQFKIRDKVLRRAIEKFGWPIPPDVDTAPFLVDLPEANGWRWYTALEVAQSWKEFSRLLRAESFEW